MLAKDLRKQPVAVELHKKPLVVFRTASGQLGAFDDNCPHRRMKLSLGKVVGEKLQCLYHGWTFDCQGQGESPATPKLYACAKTYDAVERHGAIWIKPSDSKAEFPNFELEGYHHLGVLSHTVKAPLELVVDNFCEIEHTPTTHAFFGYPLERMQEVKVEFRPTDTTVRVINQGPRKRFSTLLRLLLGIGDDYLFMDDWTTYFSPVYSVYDHWFQCPTTGKENWIRWRLFIFFVPRNDGQTSLFTFSYVKSKYPGSKGGTRLFGPYMMSKLNYEIELDRRILEGLADHDTSIDGMKLSRFDRVLGLNRERINRIYRGGSQPEIRAA